MVHVHVVAALLAGTLTLLPSCGPALVPAFFAYSFKQTQQLVKATAVFALGFTVIFVPFGMGVEALANIIIFQKHEINVAIGILLIVFGLLSLFNVSGPRLQTGGGDKKSFKQIFLLGLTFGFTAGACSAPIYGAIITLATSQSSALEGFLLLLAYEFGMFVPLLFLALVFDRYNLLNRALLKGKGFSFTIGKQTISFYSTNIIAAALFIALGVSFLVSGDGMPFMNSGIGSRLLDKFYILNNKLLAASQNPKLFYILAVLLLVGGITVFMTRKKK